MKYSNNMELKKMITIGEIVYLLIMWQLVLPIISSMFLGVYEGLTGENCEKNNLILVLITDLLTMIVFFRSYKKYSTSSRFNKEHLKGIILGIILVLCSGDCVARGLALLPNFEILFSSYEQLMDGFEGSIVLKLLVVVICGPVVEEVFFRGFLYEYMKQKFSMWMAIIVSSLLFGAIHFNFLQLISAFALGVILCIIYEKTNNLGVCVLVHMANNLISVMGCEIRTETSLLLQLLIIFAELVVIGILMLKFLLPLEDREKVTEYE